MTRTSSSFALGHSGLVIGAADAGYNLGSVIVTH
jgi:hypothetical protein